MRFNLPQLVCSCLAFLFLSVLLVVFHSESGSWIVCVYKLEH